MKEGAGEVGRAQEVGQPVHGYEGEDSWHLSTFRLNWEFLSVRMAWNLGTAIGLAPSLSPMPGVRTGSASNLCAFSKHVPAVCPDKTGRTLPSQNLPSTGWADKKLSANT